jgi:TM2 domain-containing membrane protein YozV
MKTKVTAGVLALLLGGLGFHKFYLNRPLQGVIYLIFCWTFIPSAVAFIEGILYLVMSDESFNAKYNTGLVLLQAQAQPQNIVVNVANTASSGGGDVSERLRSLMDLRTSGALTEDEFNHQKQKLLAMG